MNRVIKFKIWDTVEKKFLSLKSYQNLGAIEVENDGTLTLSPRFRFLTSMMIMPERFIPLQYIGLKDKNGKEIYEGDIIDIHQTVNGYNQFVIEYYTYKFSARYYDKDKKVIGSLYNYDLDELFEINEFEKELEIVGNIYESEVEDNAKWLWKIKRRTTRIFR